MTTFAVTSVSSHLCHASTCLRMGSKLRCIRSTPTEMQSMRENDFECFASTGVNTPETIRQCQQCRFEVMVSKLRQSLAAAEASIFFRCQALCNNPDAQARREAIMEATHA